MSIKTAKTQEGIVVRVISASGECAYRENWNGSWDRCADHKGPWVSVNKIYVPREVLRAVAEVYEQAREEARNHIPCHGVAP